MMFCSPAGAGTLGAALAAVATSASAPTRPIAAMRIFAASSRCNRLDINNRRWGEIPRRANPGGTPRPAGPRASGPHLLPASSAGVFWRAGEDARGPSRVLAQSGIHRVEELGVALRFLELVDQEFE